MRALVLLVALAAASPAYATPFTSGLASGLFGNVLDTAKGFAPYVIALVCFRVLVWALEDWLHEKAGTGRWKKPKARKNTRGGR